MHDLVAKINAQAKGKIAVLYGGNSSEREVSLKSGEAVIQALRTQGLNIIALDTRQQNLIDAVKANNIKHAVIALHGGDGEDGTVQAVLETLDVTYTGSGVLGSALAMDKLRSKQLWMGVGVSTADYAALHENTNWQQTLEHLGGRCIVKPSLEGSSIGMYVAENAHQLEQAYKDAVRFGSSVIAERWIEGPEYTVAILDEQALPVIRLKTENKFYDFEAKYESNDTQYICPCGLAKAEEEKIQQLAVHAFQTLGCSGWGRVDVMCDASSNQNFVLEVNTSPGMTDHSLVPMAAKQAGMDFQQLTLTILAKSMALI